jgi:hypothetical protein
MNTTDNPTCLDRYLGSFEHSVSSRNYKPDTLKNYRHLLRRFAKLLEAERIEPSALTADLAVELGRRFPTTPKSQIKIPNLARLFVGHLVEIGVATRPALTPVQVEGRPPGLPLSPFWNGRPRIPVPRCSQRPTFARHHRLRKGVAVSTNRSSLRASPHAYGRYGLGVR